jgi:hypothetical protein
MKDARHISNLLPQHSFQLISTTPLSTYPLPASSVYLTAGVAPDVPIVIDTGASTSLTPFREDFIGPIEPASISKVTSIGATPTVEGEGTASWNIVDCFGHVKTITTRAFLIPEAGVRLYSPQSHFKSAQGGSLHLNSSRACLMTPEGSSLEFPYHFGNFYHSCISPTTSVLTPDLHRSTSHYLVIRWLFSTMLLTNAIRISVDLRRSFFYGIRSSVTWVLIGSVTSKRWSRLSEFEADHPDEILKPWILSRPLVCIVPAW